MPISKCEICSKKCNSDEIWDGCVKLVTEFSIYLTVRVANILFPFMGVIFVNKLSDREFGL